MIKTASVAALIGALLVMPAAAEAHKLSKARAAKAAKAKASRFAEPQAQENEYTESVLATPRYCARISAHRVRCGVAWDLTLEGGQRYEDGTTYKICSALVTVWFSSRRSRRVSARLRDVDCEPPEGARAVRAPADRDQQVRCRAAAVRCSSSSP
jgi:hypothetical protein